jgi:hypothetical protein
VREICNNSVTLSKDQRIMGIKDGEEVQAKGIRNIFNKIKQKNSQISPKSCPFRYRKLSCQQKDLTKIIPLQWHFIINTTSTENREKILKAVREKKKNKYDIQVKPSK